MDYYVHFIVYNYAVIAQRCSIYDRYINIYVWYKSLFPSVFQTLYVIEDTIKHVSDMYTCIWVFKIDIYKQIVYIRWQSPKIVTLTYASRFDPVVPVTSQVRGPESGSMAWGFRCVLEKRRIISNTVFAMKLVLSPF